MNNSEKSTTSNTKIIFAIALFAVALLLGIVGYMYTYEYEEGINKVVAVTDAFYDAFMFVTLNNSEHIKSRTNGPGFCIAMFMKTMII